MSDDVALQCCCDDERTLQPCGMCRLGDHHLCAGVSVLKQEQP